MSPLRNSFSYRAILKRAYELTKKNKILWFFGFFAAFLGVGGELESLFQNYSSVTGTSKTILSIQTFYQDGIFGTIFGNIREFFGAYPAQGFLFLLLLFVVTILILWLSIVSQIALFDSAKKLNANKKVVYQEAYQVGNRHFGSVLGVTLLLRGLWYALLAVLGSVLVSWFLERESLAGGIALISFILLILIPISVIVSFMLRYAVAYIVLKEKSAIEAVRLGWQLFKANWIISVEMALLIVVLGLVAGLVIAIGIGLASVPFILIGIAATFFGSASGFAVAVVAMTIVWFLVAALVGSMYVAFQYSAWTLLFTELDKSRAESKVVRLLNRLGIRTA